MAKKRSEEEQIKFWSNVLYALLVLLGIALLALLLISLSHPSGNIWASLFSTILPL